ncbi:MAG: NAD(P)H-quinone oxidoreductase subunit O, partial [Cyanobium sp.]
MAATPSGSSEPASTPPAALKKGALVRLNLAAYQGSLEASASQATPPAYVL